MKVVVAIDSFKGCMSSIEAGTAAGEGIKRVYPEAEIKIFSVADGGEGTVEALVEGMSGRYVVTPVKDPLGRTIHARYGIVSGNVAVIEMSAAAGITLLSKEELNPMETTTYGVGEIIKDAINNGCREFIIGIGGSATNDGGVGMLQALGFQFLDKDGKDVPFGAKCLSEIQEIEDNNVCELIKECKFNIACDVKNPLYGENGCSKIYAPQKGATDEQLEIMDDAMKHYAYITSKKYCDADAKYPGSGAAGGLGFSFMTYLNGKLKPGIELVLDAVNLEKAISNADIVVTGEGRLDAQTVMGKVPVGVAKLAKKYGKPTIAFAGAVKEDAKQCNEHGIDGFFPIVRVPCALSDAMNSVHAKANMMDTVEQVARIIRAFNNQIS